MFERTVSNEEYAIKYSHYLDLVKQNGLALKDIEEEYKTYELCSIAIKQNSLAFKYVTVIKLSHLNSDDAKQKLAVFLACNNSNLFRKKQVYQIPAMNVCFRLSHHLIFDAKCNHPEKKHYFIISKKNSDVLGIGSRSKVRKILGDIELQLPTKTIVYQQGSDLGVRISNFNQSRRDDKTQSRKPYSHQEALRYYNRGHFFKNLGLQQPILLTIYTKTKRYEKSYGLLKVFPGQDIDVEVLKFISKYHPSTADMLDRVIIPLFEAYKKQIAISNRIHRDIKPGNVRMLLDSTQSIINFVDFEACKKIGEIDSAYGSPGYAPPEVLRNQFIIVKPARDMFALGILCYGCFNYELDPLNYYQQQKRLNFRGELEALQGEELAKKGHYAADHMDKLFSLMHDKPSLELQTVQTLIKSIFSQLTQFDPDKRPKNVEEVIIQLKKASHNLKLASIFAPGGLCNQLKNINFDKIKLSSNFFQEETHTKNQARSQSS